jgi:hypothetical protein
MLSLDIHMIKTPGWEKNFQEQKKLLERSNITVYEVDYIKDHVLYARANGFSKGTAKYVSYFDDDDRVLDVSWIDEALQRMEDDKSIAVIYPRYQATRNNKIVYVSPDKPFAVDFSWPRVHSLSIFRREYIKLVFDKVIDELAPLKPAKTSTIETLIFQGMTKFGTLVHVPNIAYSWDLRSGSARLTQLEKHVELWVKEFRQSLMLNQ